MTDAPTTCPTPADAIAALPAGLDEEIRSETQQSLARILEELTHRPIPVGRLNRFWALGSLQARLALGYLAWWLRKGFISADASEAALNEQHLRAALRMLATMGYMRGVVMKIGQALSQIPNLLPEQFLDVAGHLYFDAPPMHYSMLREHVRNELGADPQDVFDDFEPRAFAAASLGQVHRARLKGPGHPVAVKIQYPNIARTIQEDIRNLITLMFPMRLSSDWENLKVQMTDVAEMLDDESDYLQEAANQEHARSLFTPDDGVVVPRVYEDLSARRVLTMDYLDGLHLRAYLRTNPSQSARDRHGASIFRSSLRTWYAGRMTYADPHPGNYLFLPDGRLGLLDFGCCRRFTNDEWEYLKRVEDVFDKDDEALRLVLAESTDLPVERVETERDRFDLLVKYTNWIWEPMRTPGVFDFGADSYLERGMALYGEVVRRRYTRSKPVNTWISRCFIGLRVMAYGLRCRLDARSLYLEERRAGFEG